MSFESRMVGIGGYWIICDDGTAHAFGSAPPVPGDGEVRAIAARSPSSGWTVTADGRITAFGDAPPIERRLRRHRSPIVGAATSHTLGGGWVARADGTVEAFGDAPRLDSRSGIVRAPVVAIAASPLSDGVWLASEDAEIATVGDAWPAAHVTGQHDARAVGLAAAPDGQGVWLAFRDGAVFTLGSAAFLGAAVDPSHPVEIVSMGAARDGSGYLLLGARGELLPLGIAAVHGPWRPLAARARALVPAHGPPVPGAHDQSPPRAVEALAETSGLFGTHADARALLPADGLVLPTSDEPTLSVVIPVHGQPDALARTLAALAAAPGPLPLEVIVVDDVSPDDTLDLLASVEGSVVIRNAENLGFLDSCHVGVDAARGRHILLLNSDAEVGPRTIESMLETLESDPQIAMVGARLVYPDGRLQEAGGIVWNDADAHNYGRRDPYPDSAQYLHVRDVDYCSGACLLVRRAAWDEVGGFDRRFAPAYYEDTDLAFALRAAGYRVVYDPDAVVVHHEGLSHGTDVGSGTKRFQDVNRGKFAEKWRDELSTQHANAAQNVWRARQRADGARVLWIDSTTLTPDRDSGSLRADTVLTLLQDLGCAVSFAPSDRRDLHPYTHSMRRRGIEYLKDRTDVVTYLEQMGPALDLCILSRPDPAWDSLRLVRELSPTTTVVFDTVDLHHIRMQRGSDEQTDIDTSLRAEHMRRQEVALFRSVDAVIAVTEEERALVEEIAPGVRTFVIPNVHRTAEDVPGPAGRDGLLFVGSFLHPPNIPAALYLVEELMPALRAKLPEITLTVVGEQPPDELVEAAARQPGVTLPGWVRDLTSLYRTSRVFVAPLRVGAGMKGKIGEAMAEGLPVVTSPIGAEGMGIESGRTALITNDLAGEIEAICSLVGDDALWSALSRQAVDHIRARFSRDAVRSVLDEMLRTLGSHALG